MAVIIVSCGAPTSATTDTEICPPVVVSNQDTANAIAVGVAWEGDPIGCGDLEYASFTILGPAGGGALHSQETLYPNVKVMPSGPLSTKINVLKINADGCSWSKSGVSKSVSIANSDADGGDGETDCPKGSTRDTVTGLCVEDKKKTSIWIWVAGGVAALAVLGGGAYLLLTGKKK